MSYGLQIRDASNNITLDTDTKVGRVIGQMSVSANANSYFDVSRLSGEKVFAVLTTSSIQNIEHVLYIADSSTGFQDINGNRVVYNLGNASGYITYGVY